MAVEKILTEINKENANLDAIFKSFFIDNHTLTLDFIKDDVVKNFILAIQDSKKTAFGNKLSELESICNQKIKEAKEFNATEYINQANTAKSVIKKLIELYDEEMAREEEKLAKEKSVAAMTQTDVTRATQEISGIKNDINRVNSEIGNIQQIIEKLTDSLDSKVFQVLINTVSLLGIFVAIAFAGFGTMNIFTNIDIATWMQSTESFVKNTFVLLATSLLAYNLLLLLIYFIYKLSRPLPSTICFFLNKPNKSSNIQDTIHGNEKKTENTVSVKPESFKNEIKLIPFVVVDIVMLVLTVILFIYCINNFSQEVPLETTDLIENTTSLILQIVRLS